MAVCSDVDPEPLRHLDGILPDDEVHVWHVDLIAWEKEADSLFELLDSAERERAARFKFPAPRNQFLISRALLRRALGRYLRIEARDIRFRTTANGKPELAKNRDPRFDDLRFDDLRFDDLNCTGGKALISTPSCRQEARGAGSCAPDTNPVKYVCRRHGPRNEVTLADVTSQLR